MSKYLKLENYIHFIKSKSVYLMWIKLIFSKRLSCEDYIIWKKSLKTLTTEINELPWITIESTKWLEKILDNTKTVFEWGSGGSTLFFVNKVKSVVSIEHDIGWWKSVEVEISKKQNKNCEYILIEPEENKNSNTKDYTSSTTSSLNYKKYCQKIRDYPDAFFDVIMIDGRSRNSCMQEAIPKTKVGGIIILDNSERIEYQKGIQLLNRWKRKDFFGPILYGLAMSQTSIFTKTEPGVDTFIKTN